MPGQRDLAGWRRGPGVAQGGPGPGGPQGGPGVAHGPSPAAGGGDHEDGDDGDLDEGPPAVKEEFQVPRRARQAQVQAEAYKQQKAAKVQQEAIKRQEADSMVLDLPIFEAEVQRKAVGLGSTPGFETMDPAVLEEFAREAMARQGYTAREEVGPEARIKQELQAQRDQLRILDSVRRQLKQLGKWQVYAGQARQQIAEWNAELAAIEDRVKSVERHSKVVGGPAVGGRQDRARVQPHAVGGGVAGLPSQGVRVGGGVGGSSHPPGRWKRVGRARRLSGFPGGRGPGWHGAGRQGQEEGPPGCRASGHT